MKTECDLVFPKEMLGSKEGNNLNCLEKQQLK